ncbi:PstS family phosphate ABC transporter substrate-binding protein [Chryseobacterium sp.]|uniref:PstS family phosphate ABC transporter substrate-binding protein n=1 Tax=Chryseobacterium sp. TaxID=1871047 RepID=UPI0012A9FA57|nr:substrate-binding domain-containing protein [Chryseobacterium sp.]QFG54023.1 phosphate ABC transporter substrate-binding protein [Chryseobacterium sp.]
MRINIFIIMLSAMLFGCKKKAEPTVQNYHEGKLTVFTDESFQSVTVALADGYMIHYPDTEVKVEVRKEDLGFLDLLQGRAKVAVMSRDLSPAEIDEFERVTESKYEPAKFAADALVFIVPKDSERSALTMEEISAAMESPDKQLIFDGTNASNLNFIAQKLGKKASDLQYSIISGNRNIIGELKKYPGKIGVIGLNTLSRPYSQEADSLRSQVKILPVSHNGKITTPDTQSLANMSYPFTRVLYFLVNERTFGIAHGFIRFSCTHLGQMIVDKEGLQKYNLYQREVKMY